MKVKSMGETTSGLQLTERSDGSLKVEYDITAPGLHYIHIMVDGTPVSGSPIYCHVQLLGSSYSVVYGSDITTVMNNIRLKAESSSKQAPGEIAWNTDGDQPGEDMTLPEKATLPKDNEHNQPSPFCRLATSVFNVSPVPVQCAGLGRDAFCDPEPYTGMRLPVIIPASEYPEEEEEEEGQNGSPTLDGHRSETFTAHWIKHEALSDDDEEGTADDRPSQTRDEAGVYPDCRLPDGDDSRLLPDASHPAALHPDAGSSPKRALVVAAEASSRLDGVRGDTLEPNAERRTGCEQDARGRSWHDPGKESAARKRNNNNNNNSKRGDRGFGLKNNDQPLLRCHEGNCNRQFKTPTRLKVHKQIHDFLKSLGGVHAGGDLSSLVQLQATRQSDRNTDVVIMYRCPDQTCTKYFKSCASLEKHLTVHCTPLYRCTEEGCTRRFHLKKALVLHTTEHKQERHICSKCSKEYRSKKHLQIHMRYHTDNSRKFVCTVPGCNSRFNLERYLQQHMFTHKTTYDFLCHICGKAFKRSECLRAHLLSKAHQKLDQELKP